MIFFSENIIGAYLHVYINTEIRYKIRIFLHCIQGIKITNDFQEYNLKDLKSLCIQSLWNRRLYEQNEEYKINRKTKKLLEK